MHDPTDYSKPLLPELHHGKIGGKRKSARADDDDIDDDAPAPQWVIDVLGFDPKDI